MPPVVSHIAIPVINRSPDRLVANFSNGFEKLAVQPRTYNDEPLPVKPSEHAPRQAQILGREVDDDGVSYSLEIGGVPVDKVTLEEILDFVSPFELEKFENCQFEEEREVMKTASMAQEAEDEKRRERARVRAKTKGTVTYQGMEDDPDVNNSADAAEVAVGRHGRARPTYGHLYLWQDRQRKRRRKRDPATGELIPLSDDEDFSNQSAAFIQPLQNRASGSPPANLPKRRRRKRDPATGELLPLEPISQSQTSAQSSNRSSEQPTELPIKVKRSRRVRHPLTGELMPLGWRYNPDNEKVQEERRGWTQASTPAPTPALQTPSIDGEHVSKRMKLDSESSSTPSEDLAILSSHIRSHTASGRPMDVDLGSKKAFEMSESDNFREESSREPPKSLPRSSQTPRTKTSLTQPMLPVAQQSTATSSATSPEPMTLQSFLSGRGAVDTSSSDESSNSNRNLKKTPIQRKTSIMNPVGTPIGVEEAEDGDDEDMEDDEYLIEAILGHQMSDPRTHPGKPSTMLYKVKWEGFDKPTWEPYESFGDPSTVLEYRKHVGLDAREEKAKNTRVVPKNLSLSRSAMTSEPKPTAPNTITHLITQAASRISKSQSSTAAAHLESQNTDDEHDADNENGNGDESWDVEAILAHHISDPSTHPPGLGKKPVMLYQVKWSGYEKPTWEPPESFTDLEILKKYRQRAGLRD